MFSSLITPGVVTSRAERITDKRQLKVTNEILQSHGLGAAPETPPPFAVSASSTIIAMKFKILC